MFRATGLLIAVCLAGCDSSAPPPSVGAAIHHDENTRLVTVFLESEPNNGFIPVYADRVIVAEPVIVVPGIRAEGKTLVQNIDTVIVGSRCADLYAKYPSLSDCEELETVDFEYGEIEATTTTDTEGFSGLLLGQHDKYRISVQSWVTAEDDKCHWGGSEIIEHDDTMVGVPVLVFCE